MAAPAIKDLIGIPLTTVGIVTVWNQRVRSLHPCGSLMRASKEVRHSVTRGDAILLAKLPRFVIPDRCHWLNLGRT
ncbi:13396_t:CDS:2 [Funneliformis mosseae]|uniref:13396_t:CDS:1 n=1 Tax=Funneliformis mosseae TaxID=27381 RepID=A0A9N8VLJ9_FUNMO|nr:13396_t:CDS:2 [Funneliformis mosseae]